MIKPKQNISIAYLLNADKKPVLAGFITDSTTTISVESTAKVLLYFALGVLFMEDTVTNIYVNRVHEVPGIADWINDFTQAWKADPLAFSSGSYSTKLRPWLEEKNKVATTAGNRAGSVNVNSNDVRSGLRLSPEGLGISFTNSYRRRAKAFFYKMGHKLEGNNAYKPILSSIGIDTDFEKTLGIDPASGVTSVSGEVWKQVSGRGTESFAVTSGPAVFELEDNETEAHFRARVVGFGYTDISKLSKKETESLYWVQAETTGLDVMMPVLGAAMGAARTDNDGDEIAHVILIDGIKLVPGLFDMICDGEYEKAFLALIDGMASEHGFDFLVALVRAGFDPEDIPVNFESQAKKGAFILQAIDLALLGGDFVRIITDATASRGLEEWDFTIRSSKVTLTPNESVVSIFAPSNKEELEAKVQNLSSADASKVVYNWTVQGKFGTISDNQGHTGTSFESSQKKISFTVNNDPGLTDGDNWETVIVTALLDGKEIGSDTARINVKRSRYEMLPGDVTLSGRAGQTNLVKLRLEPVGNGAPIGPNNDFDYKIVWETSGRHGGLRMHSGANTKNITTYDNNVMMYECVDDKTKTSTETINARVFAKKKGLPETDYRLIDNVKVTIKIENDDKKKIVHIPLTCSHGDSYSNNGNSVTCMITTYVSFMAEKDAQSYRVKFYNVRWPASYSWNANGNQPQKVNDFVVAPSEGVFNVAYGSSWGNGPTHTLKEHKQCGGGSLGMAEVIITLK